MSSYSTRITVDPFFDIFAGKPQERIAQIINSKYGNVVSPCIRRNLDEEVGLGRMKAIAPNNDHPCSMSSLVRLIGGKEYVKLIKNDHYLMRKLVMEVLLFNFKKLSNMLLITFYSNGSKLNAFLASAMESGAVIFNKWQPGALKPREGAPSWTKIDMSEKNALNELHGWLRTYVDTNFMVKHYLRTFKEEPMKRLCTELVERGSDIVLWDDTLNTGVSMVFQSKLLNHYGISYEKIHAISLLNENFSRRMQVPSSTLKVTFIGYKNM